MDPERKRTIYTLCGVVLIIALAVFLINGGGTGEPPKLTVSNELGNKISAQRGTYSWKNGSSDVTADSAGPMGLYNQGHLPHIEPSENDGCSLTLKFGAKPATVDVVIYPAEAAQIEDYTSMIYRETAGYLSDYKFTVPSDGIYIVNVRATWAKGEAYYYFYTTP